MPYRVFDFTPEQEALIRGIEDKTCAEVIVIAPYRTPSCGDRDHFRGFLSRPGEYLHELESEDLSEIDRMPWAEENGKLSYIADHPKTGRMSEAELRKYPENIRRALEKSVSESCNIVDPECTGNDIEEVLRELQGFTVLLKMGWHLGREEDFDDPFLPEEEEESAEDEIWWEYNKFSWFLKTGTKEDEDDEEEGEEDTSGLEDPAPSDSPEVNENLPFLKKQAIAGFELFDSVCVFSAYTDSSSGFVTRKFGKC